VTDRSFGISVNVSGRQVADSEFVTTLAGILDSTRLDPRRLTIELTESTLLEDTEATIAWLSLLKELGIRLALDDFGTGFSSLSYLRRLPVDCLKVDASFVRSIAPDGSGGELAIAVVNLARTLRLRTVAEGVEHAHQAEFLTRSGCRFAQGFYYCKPLPHAEVPGFLRAFAAPKAPPELVPVDRSPELVSQSG
jgi:EAL domain-containing protein (putative c-di-GMP-specific phosphodiesterase class I)